MAGSLVELWNRSLLAAGGKLIRDPVSDQGADATHARTCWPGVRDAELRLHNWSFARVRVDLRPMAGVTVPSGWAYAFELPGDCLALRAVRVNNRPVPYELASLQIVSESGSAWRKVVLADIEILPATYTRRVTETTLYDPLFDTAVVMSHAAELLYRIGYKQSKFDGLMAAHKLAIRQAVAANLIEKGRPQPEQDAVERGRS